MTQYFFDVTDLRAYLARHRQLSGIQRVSVMTIARARTELGAENVWFCYHDRHRGHYRACRSASQANLDLTRYETLCALLKIHPSTRNLPGMEKYAGRPLKRQYHIWLCDLRSRLGHERYFRKRGTTLKSWREARRSSKNRVSLTLEQHNFEDVARRNDQLILLDNAWQPTGLDKCLQRAHTDLGVEVTVLLHDMIPLVVPHYTIDDVCLRFHDWLVRSTGFVTRYLANSENTGRDIRDFLDHCGGTQPVHVVPLARAPLGAPDPSSNMESPDPASAYPAFAQGRDMPDDIRALTKTEYVLIVGTMEVRKNLWRVATVWDRLRREKGRELPKLVIAGRKGWLNDDFENWMKATGNLGGWIQFVEGASDDILAYLYRNCLFTITASFYEGWGLPIGESLAYGKTAVVSNTSSMPEVGEDMVEYCDPHSLDSIEAACLKLIDNPVHRRDMEARITSDRLRSWEDVARDMLVVVKNEQPG